MTRKNEQRLERECDTLRKMLIPVDPGDNPVVACGHSCVAAIATGVATNGPCSCDEQKLRRAVMYWRRLAVFRMQTIAELRDGKKIPCPTCRCLVVGECLCCKYSGGPD